MGVAWGMEGGGTEKVAFSRHKLTMFLWCGIIKPNNVRMVENMNEKDFLAKQQKESIKRLKSIRRTWFLWIWLGYSGFIFWLFLNLTEISGWGWLATAIISLI